MADLEERLRRALEDKDAFRYGDDAQLLRDAADLISAQTAEIERLKERVKESARNYPLAAVKEIAAQTQTISDLTRALERIAGLRVEDSFPSRRALIESVVEVARAALSSARSVSTGEER